MNAQAWLGKVVVYGGIPVRRVDMERHLDELGVTGPARLRYASLPETTERPEERWTGDRWAPLARPTP
jgi:hypothetical protein